MCLICNLFYEVSRDVSDLRKNNFTLPISVLLSTIIRIPLFCRGTNQKDESFFLACYHGVTGQSPYSLPHRLHLFSPWFQRSFLRMVTEASCIEEALWKPESSFPNYNLTRCASDILLQKDFWGFGDFFGGFSVFMASNSIVFQENATVELVKVCFEMWCALKCRFVIFLL